MDESQGSIGRVISTGGGWVNCEYNGSCLNYEFIDYMYFGGWESLLLHESKMSVKEVVQFIQIKSLN